MAKKTREWYDALKAVPQDALKMIQGGRLEGFSSINPMWRIEKLTELFGPYGVGWYFTIDEELTLPAMVTDETLIKVKVSLFVKVGENEDGSVKFSIPAVGYGTSKLIAKERGGLRLDDDAYKKAVTDAFGNAAKYYGVGAEVYYKSVDDNKYDYPTYDYPFPEPPQAPQPIKPIGAKLGGDEVIHEDHLVHLGNILAANSKDPASVLAYVNAQRKGAKAESLNDFTYGEYCEVLGFFKQ